MQKIILSTIINAPKEKVWEVLWDLDAYRAWTEKLSQKAPMYKPITGKKAANCFSTMAVVRGQ